MLLVLFACAEGRPAGPDLEPTGPPAVAPPRTERARQLASATIVAVGDVMMHGQVKRTAQVSLTVDAEGKPTNHGGFDAVWADVTPLFQAADLAFANFESPVAPEHRKLVKEMVFDADPVVLDSLHASGIDVVSFANNHVYDQGRDGFLETVERLEAHPLEYVGSGRSCPEARRARILDAGGIKVAFIGATDLYNDDLNAAETEPCAATLSPRAAAWVGGQNVGWVLDEAEAARAAGAELVVLSVHWGLEYRTAPEKGIVAVAQRLVDEGVDVILGHHPHVIQPVEVRVAPDGRLGVIAYSLGNFVSGQAASYVPGLHAVNAGNPRDGLLLSFRVVRWDLGRAKGGGRLVRTELADLEVVPLWTDNNQVRRRGDEPVSVTVAPTLLRIERLREAVLAGPDDDLAARLARELVGMEQRWAQVTRIAGEAVVPPLP